RKDLVFYEESGGGVTFSGGEPFGQSRFLKKLLLGCREERIHTAVDTSGYVSPAILHDLSPLIDLILFDLKFIDNEKQYHYTGVSVKPILKNLMWLQEHKRELIVRIPLIPGITDTDENLKNLAKYLYEINYSGRIDLLPYNPLGEDKYKKLNKERKLGKLKHQSVDELNHMKTIFMRYGFNMTNG
ncbi:MAG: glycyl-radical enzyme activating protein, partial [Calditrichaeota bacterium]